ncbi:MAG: hypothetical protein R3310_05685 [Candidatus Competibacteraceae bacterium]|nr:hypothetical protein [Candidatus Competibacteraceae bacterium]
MKTKLTLTAAILLALGLSAHAQDADPSGWKEGGGPGYRTFQEADVDRDEMLSEDEYNLATEGMRAEIEAFKSKSSIRGEEGPYEEGQRSFETATEGGELGADVDPMTHQSKSSVVGEAGPYEDQGERSFEAATEGGELGADVDPMTHQSKSSVVGEKGPYEDQGERSFEN